MEKLARLPETVIDDPREIDLSVLKFVLPDDYRNAGQGFPGPEREIHMEFLAKEVALLKGYALVRVFSDPDASWSPRELMDATIETFSPIESARASIAVMNLVREGELEEQGRVQLALSDQTTRRLSALQGAGTLPSEEAFREAGEQFPRSPISWW